ncbi:hypothetical protein LWF01_07460 [Saxibacter everestensis]|uniref:Large polyvalent protein associated domain-containing protein n=1 Tax=Saxibacter everestensis TaxID=2909229 RepID=A0ABY8QZ96_9MICO|nr:hypothetical protein LWF01_07460 [Brevibacteriaceae bacterium ZFBP1038]
MTHFEVTVDEEHFTVKSRSGPRGTYDFGWINGPVAGYGFSTSTSDGHRIPREDLIESIRNFLEVFYGPGGIGEEDFPEHVPAAIRRRNRSS